MTEKRGLILISHRLSNLQFVNKIVFLDGGRTVEIGSHKELLKKMEGIMNYIRFNHKSIKVKSYNNYINFKICEVNYVFC